MLLKKLLTNAKVRVLFEEEKSIQELYIIFNTLELYARKYLTCWKYVKHLFNWDLHQMNRFLKVNVVKGRKSKKPTLPSSTCAALTIFMKLMYLQFWTFIERWQFFFIRNKINDYVYIYGSKNIQSFIKYTLLFNLLKRELII